MLKIIKWIKTKIKERKMKKELEKHCYALDQAYEQLVSNRPLSLWYRWNPEKYELLYDRVVAHDIDKSLGRAFDCYREYLYPINKEEKQNATEKFTKTIETHRERNRHHWEARVNDDPNTMTEDQELDCFEEVLDMMARMQEKSLDYFLGFKNNMNIPQIQKDFIERVLFNIYKDGEAE